MFITGRFNTASGRYCCNFNGVKYADKVLSFNTASGRYCCNIKDCYPLWRQSIIVSIPQAVGTVATSYFSSLFKTTKDAVSIPQAVGTVATLLSIDQIKTLGEVSIPQAVGTVATKAGAVVETGVFSFNTASGRYCCNSTYRLRY